MYAQYVKNAMQPLNIADITKDQLLPWTVSTPAFYLFLFSVFYPFVFLSLDKDS